MDIEIVHEGQTHHWTRTNLEDIPNFQVRVYVEGYRPHKEVWLYATYGFDTLKEALEFYLTLEKSNWEQKEFILRFAEASKDTGWYGMSLEFMEVYENTPMGYFKWEPSLKKHENHS